MNENKRKKIEEELFYLLKLIEFHNGARETMWKGRSKELEIYMDDMLDYMNDLRQQLKELEENNKKK